MNTDPLSSPGNFVGSWIKQAERDLLHANPDDYDSREDVWADPAWADLIMRSAAAFITDLAETLGGCFTPDGPGPNARQAWFGDDFNYGVFIERGEGWSPPSLRSQWNAAFLYNGGEMIAGLIRLVGYEMARRGYLPPNAVGKNTADFAEGGALA